MKKVMTVLGTRPEIIKLSLLVELLDKEFKHILVHTGQHYSKQLNEVFIKNFNLREPNYHLDIGSGTHAEQTSKIMLEIEKILIKEKPDIVLVQGDTNTTIGVSIAAVKLHIKIGHVEAGCRSFNKKEPEEINRVVTDHCASLFFIPDKYCYNNLIREGINEKNMYLTGNTSFDIYTKCKELTNNKIIKRLNLKKDNYILLTIHRASNTDNKETLQDIIDAINELSSKIPIVFPIHPRTQKALDRFNINLNDKVKVIEAVDYLEFLALLEHARIVMTDAGGIQEEAIMTNVPCLILNNDTPWMEYVYKKKNFIIGVKKNKIIRQASAFIDNDNLLNKTRSIKINIKKNATKNIFEVLKKVL